MTRGIIALTLAIPILWIAGCRAENGAAATSGRLATGWVTAPVIDSATRNATHLILQGQAQPGSRIVLRRETGSAFAVGTGDDGRFDIRIRPLTIDAIYILEVQDGEDAVPSPSRLLVAADPKGPLALIGEGSPTRRLDPGVGLDVIDSDGRSRLASGRAAPGTPVTITVGGQPPVTVRADGTGRWSLALDGGSQASTSVVVADKTHVYPGDPLAGAVENRLVRVGEGMALRWRLSDTARQTSWFPDRRRD